MPQISELMTRGVRSLMPTDTIMFAAQAMDELNVGVIPVCEGERLKGIVTDRDIVVRGVAQGLDSQTALSQVMSAGVHACREDQSIEEATRIMSERQIRRLPVVDGEQKLVGILSLGDIADRGGEQMAGDALEQISTPAEPDRSGISAAGGSAAGGSASGQASRTPG
ncbi:MAG: histidine kinase [Variovorax sp.]|nr:histidine kinase [Variovorax sp.]